MKVGNKVESVYRIAWCIAHNCEFTDLEEFTIIKTCDIHECIAPSHLVKKRKPQCQTAQDSV